MKLFFILFFISVGCFAQPLRIQTNQVQKLLSPDYKAEQFLQKMTDSEKQFLVKEINRTLHAKKLTITNGIPQYGIPSLRLKYVRMKNPDPMMELQNLDAQDADLIVVRSLDGQKEFLCKAFVDLCFESEIRFISEDEQLLKETLRLLFNLKILT